MKRMVDFAFSASGESPIGLLSALSCVNTIPLSGLGAFWKITLNGNILDQIDTVLQFARSMTWNGDRPVVKLVTQTYQTGVKFTKLAMAEVETQIQRLAEFEVNDKTLNLGKWLINIFYRPLASIGMIIYLEVPK